MHIHELVAQYGILFYPLVFLWTFAEGESVVILSGAASRHGIVDLRLLIAAAWLGSFMGDQLWFLVARHFGPRVLTRFPRLAGGMEIATRRLERNSTLFILCYRFIYGLRNVASLVIGASSISWARFALLNFFSAGVWSVCFAVGGYLAGRELEQVVGLVGWSTVGIMAAVTIALGLLAYRRSVRHAAIDAQAEAQVHAQAASGAPMHAIAQQPVANHTPP